MGHRCFEWMVVAAALVACAVSSLAQPTPTASHAVHIPAVAVSNAPLADAPSLAWVVSSAGKTTLMVATLTGKRVHPVAIPGGCTKAGLRWAHGSFLGGASGVRQWRAREMAVMTHCEAGGGPMHSVIWVLDTRHANAPPRKVADLAGYAHCMQWTAQDKGIAFLYVPGAAHSPDAPTSGNCESHGLGSVGVPTGDVQRVDMLSLADGKVATVTPPHMDVYEFAWTKLGRQALLYVATLAGENRWSAKLYRKWGDVSVAQWVVVNPATSPQLHDRHVAMPSWDMGFRAVYFLGIRNAKTAGPAIGTGFHPLAAP